jgi:uncharacterized SAM-binding protein YcdF (DUF218 family)
MPFDAVLIFGKHVGEDPDRNGRELRARAAAAAAAWRAGCPRIATLEARLRGQEDSGSTLVTRWLHELGVPDSAIYARDWTCSTREEVVRGAAWLQETGARTALALTARYHVERVRRLFAEAGVIVTVQTPEGLWRDANPTERAWIDAGVPDADTLRREGAVELRFALLEALVRPLPYRIRADLEIAAGRRYRGAQK